MQRLLIPARAYLAAGHHLMTNRLITLFAIFLLSFGGLLAAARAQDRDRVIVVTAGDSFSSIALREFGSSGFGRLIAEHNRMDYTSVLRIGQMIRVPLEAQSKEDAAEVFFAKGEPTLFVAGAIDQPSPLRNGAQVYARDIIKTGRDGFVSLRFPSGTAVNIQPNSLVQLAELDCLEGSITCLVELDASAGSLNSNVNHKGPQRTRLIIHTPHASAAVRGTVFDIDASNEVVLVGVTDGEVDVSAQGRSTGLLRGLGVKTEAGQASEPPVRLLNAPDLRRLPPRVTVEDTLHWYALPGAANYLIAISRDPDGSATLYQVPDTALVHRIQAFAPGDYFLLVRAQDENGFKGFPAVQQIRVAAVDASISRTALSLVEDNGEQILTATDSVPDVAGIEVQLSTTREFTEVSGVDVPLNGGVVFVPSGVPQFARARVIVDDSTVSSFGPVLDLPAR